MARRADLRHVAPRRQRGAALLALLAVIMLGSAWMLTTRLNEGSASFKAQEQKRNSEALQRAKLALIGYVATQASKESESNPGALPCPEDSSYFPLVSGALNPNEGNAATSCTLPAVGRFPWRTVGIDKLVDAAGEPLWYVVSAGWAYTGSNTVINSDSTGQLTVDGVANDAVALIIAPGRPLGVRTGETAPTGCTNYAQTRSTTTIDSANWWRNYLECDNATYPADASFVTTASSDWFNDQVIRVTTADILPPIEAAIAARIEREVAPKLLAVYATATAIGGGANTGSSTALLPLAMGFSDPNTFTLASSTTSTQGLLPLSYAETTPGSGSPCTATTAPDWCAPDFVKWASGSIAVVTAPALTTYAAGTGCTVSTTTYSTLNCTYLGTRNTGTVPAATFTLTANASNLGAALRQFNSTAISTDTANVTGFTSSAATWTQGAVQSTGAMTVTVGGTFTNGAQVSDATCGLSFFAGFFTNCFQYRLTIPILIFRDHPSIGSSSAAAHFLNTGTPDTTWFLRNKWHVVSYYAVAAGMAPGGTNSCVTSGTCLSVAYHRDSSGAVDTGAQRAILIIAGRPLTGQSRSGSSTLSNWLEGDNVNGGTTFEMRSSTLITNKTFNDRVAVLSSN